jgi:uncharacterized membrane protein YhaH (DUF805 family)
MLNYLFSFKGRINRTKIWLIYISGCFAMSLPAAIWLPIWQERMKEANPQYFWFDLSVNTVLAVWIGVVFFVMMAAVVRRLHDRGKSAIWLLYFSVAPITFFIVVYFVGFPPKPPFATLMPIFFPVVFINNLWYLAEVLVLPGTKGDNRFGPIHISSNTHPQ